jgi:hypothetical protein
MRQDLIDMLKEGIAKYRNDPRWALAQLEYLAARLLLDTVREQARAEYMDWDRKTDKRALEMVVAHEVEVDKKYGVDEVKEYYNEKEANLIAWSQEMGVKGARKKGWPEEVIQEIIYLHQNIHQHPVQRRKLIETALNLDMRTVTF